MPRNDLKTFDQFVEEIRTYESDTFSAEDTEITRIEAVKIAQDLLANWSSNHLDGVTIAFLLDHFRENR